MDTDFPKLTAGQVVLMRAELSTGIVLDDNFVRYTSNQQTIYSVFDSYENAVEYINLIFRKDAEFMIYNQREEVLLYHNPNLNR